MHELLLDAGTLLGLLGALPQAYLVYKNRKQLQDVSFSSQVIICLGLTCSTGYAIANGAWLATVIWTMQLSWTAWKGVAVFRSDRARNR